MFFPGAYLLLLRSGFNENILTYGDFLRPIHDYYEFIGKSLLIVNRNSMERWRILCKKAEIPGLLNQHTGS